MTARLKIGYIGLGDIGAPMAERIAAAGWPLTVWNRTRDKMQPLLTAVLAGPLLGERLSALQWMGLALGLAGVSLVLGGKMDLSALSFEGFGWPALACTLVALVGISLGTLYQKRYCSGMPLLGGTVVQYLGALALLGAGSLLLETREVEWSLTFVLTLGWLVLV